jgi:hypothetical protein
MMRSMEGHNQDTIDGADNSDTIFIRYCAYMLFMISCSKDTSTPPWAGEATHYAAGMTTVYGRHLASAGASHPYGHGGTAARRRSAGGAALCAGGRGAGQGLPASGGLTRQGQRGSPQGRESRLRCAAVSPPRGGARCPAALLPGARREAPPMLAAIPLEAAAPAGSREHRRPAVQEACGMAGTLADSLPGEEDRREEP